MISDKEHIPPDQQILTFDGIILQDGYTLDECNLSIRSTIHLHVLAVSKEMSSSVSELWTVVNKGLSTLQHSFLRHKSQDLIDKAHLHNHLNQISYKERKRRQKLETISVDYKLQLHIEKEQSKN